MTQIIPQGLESSFLCNLSRKSRNAHNLSRNHATYQDITQPRGIPVCIRIPDGGDSGLFQIIFRDSDPLLLAGDSWHSFAKTCDSKKKVTKNYSSTL